MYKLEKLLSWFTNCQLRDRWRHPLNSEGVAFSPNTSLWVSMETWLTSLRGKKVKIRLLKWSPPEFSTTFFRNGTDRCKFVPANFEYIFVLSSCGRKVYRRRIIGLRFPENSDMIRYTINFRTSSVMKGTLCRLLGAIERV